MIGHPPGTMCDDRAVHLLAQAASDPTATDSGIAWYAPLFWLWLLAAVVFWVRRWFFSPKAEDAGDDDGLDGVPLRADATPRRPTDPAVDAATAGSRATGRGADGLTPTERLFRDEGVAPAEVPRPPTAPKATEGQPADRSGLFAKAAPPPSPGDTPTSGSPPATVAELLEGIELPCDLVPAATTSHYFNDYVVPFTTRRATPAEVGMAFGDELERLGFALRSTSDTEVEATRAEQRLVVTIHPNAAKAGTGGVPWFPHVAPGTVAVVVST